MLYTKVVQPKKKWHKQAKKMGSEYNIDISERHTFIPVSAMDEYHQEIYKRAEDFFVLRDAIYNDIMRRRYKLLVFRYVFY